jgi:hypothetical protein
MKNYFFLSVLFVLFITACAKKEPPFPQGEEKSQHLPNTVGSYWIYETFTIDSNNVEASTGIIDTITVIGDTLLNGYMYAIYKGTHYGTPSLTYKRDSSGYIVYSSGNIEYSYTNFTDTLYSGFNLMHDYYSIMKNSSVSVPAGNFTTVNLSTIFTMPNGDDINSCGDVSYEMPKHFAEGVGLVMSSCPYTYEISICRDRQRRLIEYHIQ